MARGYRLDFKTERFVHDGMRQTCDIGESSDYGFVNTQR